MSMRQDFWNTQYYGKFWWRLGQIDCGSKTKQNELSVYFYHVTEKLLQQKIFVGCT